MSRRFENKVVVVTGAAGGLGLTAAKAFAQEGAELVLLDVNAAGLADAKAQVDKLGKCDTYAVDLSSGVQIEQVGVALSEQYERVDVLFNNAGIAYGEVNQMLDSVDLDRLQMYFTINSFAPLMLAKALRGPLAAAKGVVINQSSMAANMPSTIYGATKALLNQFTYAMASIFGADGVRVNAIAPGLMETPASSAALPEQTIERLRGMQMLKELKGEAEDIANLALFLASDEARFITSEVVCCDAGCTLRGWRN